MLVYLLCFPLHWLFPSLLELIGIEVLRGGCACEWNASSETRWRRLCNNGALLEAVVELYTNEDSTHLAHLLGHA